MSNSNAGDKKVTISAALDKGSFQQATNMIRQLTAEIKKLSEASSKVNLGFGGGGGGILGGVGSRAGGINSTKVSGAGMSPVTQGIAADARGLSNVAKAGTDAIRQMTSGLKTSVSDQIQTIERLKLKLRELNTEYEKIGSGARNAGSMKAANQRKFFGVQSQLQDALGAFNRDAGDIGGGSRIVNRGGVDYYESTPGGGGGGAGGGRMQRFLGGAKSFFMNPFGVDKSGDPNAPAKPRGMSAMMNMLGLGGLGMAAGIGGGILGAYSLVNSQVLASDRWKANEQTQFGLDSLQRRARTNQAIGGLGMDIRRDTVGATALANLTPTQLRTILGPETVQAMTTMAYQDTGNAGQLGSIPRDVFRPGEGAALLARKLNNMTPEMAENLRKAVGDNRAAMSVRDTTYMGEYQGEIGSRMALMRAARLGPGKRVEAMSFGSTGTGAYPGDPRGMSYSGGVMRDDAGNALQIDNAQMLGYNTAYTPEELAGARGALARSAGARYMGRAGRMLSMQYGGLDDATSIFGAASQYGNAGAFMSRLAGGSSMSGANGLVDVAASNQIGGFAAQQLLGSSFGTPGGGANALGGMMSVANSMGGGLYGARGVQAGMADLGAYNAGSNDNLQKALNVYASVQAAPGAGLYAQEAIRNLSPFQRADILRNAKSDDDLPPELRKRGVSLDMLRNYGSQRDKFLFSRYITGQGSAEEDEAVQGVRKQGLAGYLRDQKSQGKLGDAKTLLSLALKDARVATSEFSAQGMLGDLVAGEGAMDLYPDITGGGVGDPAAGLAVQLKKAKDAAIRDKEKRVSELGPTMLGGAGAPIQEVANQLDKLGTVMDVGASQLKAGLAEASAALIEFARDVRTGKRYRAGAPKQDD